MPLNVDIPEDLYRALNEFCDARRCTKKACIELALRRFLTAEARKPAR